MKAVILTPVRLLGDGLAQCLARRVDIEVVAIVSDLSALRSTLGQGGVEVVLIDDLQTIDLEDVAAIAAEQPNLALVAFGLREQRQEVIRCGRYGFSGYVARDATLDQLCDAMVNAASGRLACSAEISSGLLRALFRREPSASPPRPEEQQLTKREGEVLRLLGNGLTNKEIARELQLSLATIKHHVHNVLEKLQVPRRSYAMRRVRDDPWIAAWPPPVQRVPTGRDRSG